MTIEDPFVGLPVDRNATDRDIAKIREQLDRIEQMLVALTKAASIADKEQPAYCVPPTALKRGAP